MDETLRDAVNVAGDRWVLLTLGALADGPRRFGDLLGDLASEGVGVPATSIAPNVLIDRLRRMERDGLISAAPYSRRPRRYVYELTEAGYELTAVLSVLSAWAARRAGAAPRVHSVCGSVLETRVWCPGCLTAVDGDTRSDTHSDDGVRWA